MSEAGDFIDAALQYEVSPYVWPDAAPGGLLRYGTSVGAIRGTIRDAANRYPGMKHDEITALASELWSLPVYERRAAAIVLLQSSVQLLVGNDLTRIEGFVRSAGAPELVDQLVAEVLLPLLSGLDRSQGERAQAVLQRWSTEQDDGLRAAASRLSALQ